MISKDQVEAILRANGVPTDSPDEQIRSVLLSARYNEDEVNTAVMVLRQNTKTNKTRVDGLHKIFRSDETLAANEISELLGIDVEIDSTPQAAHREKHSSTLQMVFVWFFSFIVAAVGVCMYMYMQEVGLFHPSLGLDIEVLK